MNLSDSLNLVVRSDVNTELGAIAVKNVTGTGAMN